MTPVTAAKVKYGVWGLICGAIIAMIIGCVPPSTHGIFARAVRLALPPVLCEPRDGKPAPPAEPVCSPSCRTSVLCLADMALQPQWTLNLR
jgi:hypothetical protein